MSESTIEVRLKQVRQQMDTAKVDAFITPRADEYLGEYVPPQNERLKWLTNFTGSAGAAVITHESAVIFVDGRYTIQVRQQVPASLFKYCHLNDEPPIAWICKNLSKGAVIGIDSRLHSYAFYKKAKAELENAGMSLKELADNPIDQNWLDRPTPEPKLALLLDETYTGKSSTSKRMEIGKFVEQAGADVALISQLDSIAWLLNIRGADISRLPVILGFAVLSKNGDLCFYTDPRKIPNDVHQHVGEGVTFRDEGLLSEEFSNLGTAGKTVMLDANTCNANAYLRCSEVDCQIVIQNDPVILPKAQKNMVELSGIKNCHIRDGSALSSFLAWLDHEVDADRLYDEGQLADKLESFRRDLDDIHDLSFDTISAAGSNGAMCHYSHTNGIPAMLTKNSLYLVDSGGQYSDGTTDVTRTVVIGKPTDEHRKMFTLVLKGHIALSNAVFPKGTCGVQLDALARQFLWQAGFDYDHGTGHGVGAFLSVHEGPQRIAKVATPMGELLPGMVLSNEPGYYKEGCYGIRCENLMAIVERSDGMMAFETLTFAPFDLRLIDKSLMTSEELSWLNSYHQTVKKNLAPLIDANNRVWLTQATSSI